MEEKTDVGLLLLRLGLGLLFLVAGFGKITGILGPGLEGFANMMLGGAWWLALLVALTELLGGLGLLAGVMTKWSGLGIAVVMIGAIGLYSLPNFNSADAMSVIKLLQDVVTLLALVAVSLLGPGEYALGE